MTKVAAALAVAVLALIMFAFFGVALLFGSPAAAGACPGTPAAPVRGHYTAAQIAALWVQEGGPPDQAQIAGAVGMAESNGDPNAVGVPTPNGRAIGLMQILGAVLPGDLRDPAVNMRNAIKKWRDAHGWTPWTTWTSGAYLKYMGASGTSGTAPAPACDGPLPTGMVARLIVIATRMEAERYNYCYGGGHGTTPAQPSGGQYCYLNNVTPTVGQGVGLDCSSSVSMLFQRAGIRVPTMVSSGFSTWGDPGPGRQVTVYSNAGHVFIVIRGRTWQTSVSNYHHGPGWTPNRSTAGFTATHPPGL